MSVLINEFDSFFEAVYGYLPFLWQSRLAEQVHTRGWPECIDLPTASGKTSAIDIAVFVLACQADRATNERTVGRRIFFAVNRRVIVDEAHDRAMTLAKRLLKAKDGIIRRVADSLRELNDDKSALPLDVAELRGGIYRDRRWARGITQPMVVATTADQLGSRLLFRGYGISPGMQPIHAALTACDSLILLDEAHVTRAFSQTLQAISKYRKHDMACPPMHFVQMTATPAGVAEDACFSLAGENLDAPRNKPLKERQEASKVAELVKVKGNKIVDELVSRADKALSEQRQAVGVIVNRVQTARDVHAGLLQRYPLDDGGQRQANIHLVIGRMRPIDRDELTKSLRSIVGPDRPTGNQKLEKPCFVVATQCLEVGADYDFDALITECAAIDALRQRFGRLNRKGRQIAVLAAILTSDAAIKDEDPVYGSALKNTWEWLTQNERKSIDFGILAFKPLWDAIGEIDRLKLMAPAPDAAILLPAHLDAFCQTMPQPVPSPDVSYFIHGPQRDNLDVQVCWRADLGQYPEQWTEIVSMLPPTSPECMTVSLRAVRAWMSQKTPSILDADIAIAEQDASSQDKTNECMILIWRGEKESKQTSSPNDLHPGDTIVLRVSEGGWNDLGYIPGTDIDIAEKAVATSRKQRVVRIHRDLPHNWINADLIEHAMSEDGTLSKDEIRRLLGFKGPLKEMAYPYSPANEGSLPTKPGAVFRFADMIPEEDPLQSPSLDEEDDTDSSSMLGKLVSLVEHTEDVVNATNRALNCIKIPAIDACLRRAAELHDLGKADLRFQAVLLGTTPDEAALRPTLLGKSGQRNLSRSERRLQSKRAQIPQQFRHEMLSVQIIESVSENLVDPTIPLDALLHLIAAHHGHARPFAPVVIDDATDDLLYTSVDELSVTGSIRRSWIPSHRLDSGIAERFWNLTRRFGWWGLAYLESILRLADQQASEIEQS